MHQPHIKTLSSGGVITNYNCVSKCGHCLYNSGPHRSKAYLAAESAAAIFKNIMKMGCRSVHIGGGEPLLQPDKLAGILTAARDVGMGIDYVETNAAWFTDAGQAAAILKDLRSAGLDTLLISISPFHNAYIPYAKTMGVIQACRQTGMNVFPWVNAFVRDLSRLDTSKTHAMEEFEAAYGPDYLQRIPDRYWVHFGGRSLETFRPVYPMHTLEEVLEKGPLSCARALSETSHFHIDLYDGYIPGLCSGLIIDMADLGHLLPAGKYLLLDQLAATGIAGLYNFASHEFGYTPQKDGFLNHCDLCTDIRKFLLQPDENQFPEIGPIGFYS